MGVSDIDYGALAARVCTRKGDSGMADPTASRITLDVKAARGDAEWGIIESPFMRDSASTLAFEHFIEVAGGSMKDSETTTLQSYGRRFEHTDANELTRV